MTINDDDPVRTRVGQTSRRRRVRHPVGSASLAVGSASGSPGAAAPTTVDWVDFDEYARTAVDLVNAQVETLERVRAFFGVDSWRAAEVTDRDVAMLRRGQRRLREIFEHGSAGRDVEAVAALNALLEAHPVQPRISGHEVNDWHMHVTSRGASVGAEYMAGAVWGLAVWLCEYGSARFGVCADDRCGNVYLDTSSNCCRRFCSERCATRSHVAAHRARKRAVVEDTGMMAAATAG